LIPLVLYSIVLATAFGFRLSAIFWANFIKKVLLAAPKYSFYFVPKGIGLFISRFYSPKTGADTAMWNRSVNFPGNF
jgi:hypothetical protein